MRPLLLAAALLLASCTDDPSPTAAPCVDRPTDLARPPSGKLPCELLPPGFGAKK